MTWNERRDLWALVRKHEKAAAADEARANLLYNYAGGSGGGYVGEAEFTEKPKGLPDGDEGWRELCERHASAATHRQAAVGLRSLLLKFGAHDPRKKQPKNRRLLFKRGAVSTALRLVGGK